jgi:hypothetical protein
MRSGIGLPVVNSRSRRSGGYAAFVIFAADSYVLPVTSGPCSTGNPLDHKICDPLASLSVSVRCLTSDHGIARAPVLQKPLDSFNDLLGITSNECRKPSLHALRPFRDGTRYKHMTAERWRLLLNAP